MGAPVLETCDLCKLGKKLIESGALMEAAFAAILQAESEKIETLIKEKASKEELKHANDTLKEIVIEIKETEKIILRKIDNGKELCNIKYDDCTCK